MLIKNKKLLIIIFFLNFLLCNLNVSAEEFNITAKEIIIEKENEVIIGKGSVVARDSEGKTVYADKIKYDKLKEFLLAEGNVKITDIEGNILKTKRATYDKINNEINTFNNTEITLQEGYKLFSQNVSYDLRKKIMISNEDSDFTDIDGNFVKVSMFQYDVKNNLFSSIGKIKVLDINKNKYSFKEIYVDTNKKEMIGSDVSVVLDQESFGLTKKNDPRFAANDIFVSENITKLSKGIFTVCQKRDNKCPPWSIKAKKITYDKIKKNIYYEHATLKIYDIPLFYFPRFFHPDPTVKRQSGFLFPYITNSSTMGNGFALPYYWALSNDKDLTFTPKYYAKENPLFLHEYRQAYKNGFLTLDASYNEGFKNTSKTKTSGSRGHIFAKLNYNLSQDENVSNDFSLKIQRTNNDTYFRNHNINTALVNSENTNLESEIRYNFAKNNNFFDITGSVYENLRDSSNSRYEYIIPNILVGKTLFTEQYGTINLKSNAFYTNYETNKYKTFLTNDVIWKPTKQISKNGFINSIESMIRNTNYKTKKTNVYKDEKSVNEIHGVLAYKSSLPMKKTGIKYSNLFSPNFMIRYAPGHMRNLSSKNNTLKLSNLYALNKTSEIESGLSSVLGFDFKINNEQINKEKFSLSIGQVFSDEENRDLPSKSSLDQKTSDIVGSMNYNFNKIGNIDYKFSVDHNLNDLNYNEISTVLNFNKVEFNIDYLEENNHVGATHYASSGVSLNFNDNNKLSFSTKKNFQRDSTEFYNIKYQYEIDCLTAGVAYRREFYRDSDLEPNNTLLFTLTFIPFGNVNSPTFNQ